MSSESRHHIRVKMVNDVAVVGFADMDVVFQPKHVQDLNDELHRLVEDEKRNKVLLNLSGIQYLSSSMLVRLININKLIEHSQGQLKLCCLSPVMLDTFRVSELEHLFETYGDEATALALFQ